MISTSIYLPITLGGYISATLKYFVSEISEAKRSFACAKAILAVREAPICQQGRLKSLAWRCINFTTKYFTVLIFCFFCIKKKKAKHF